MSTDKPMVKTPECDKMARVRDKSQAIGEFLDWLREERDVVLAEWTTADRLVQAETGTTEELLAEFFEIDLVKVEEERRALIDQLNEMAPRLALKPTGDDRSIHDIPKAPEED